MSLSQEGGSQAVRPRKPAVHGTLKAGRQLLTGAAAGGPWCSGGRRGHPAGGSGQQTHPSGPLVAPPRAAHARGGQPRGVPGPPGRGAGRLSARPGPRPPLRGALPGRTGGLLRRARPPRRRRAVFPLGLGVLRACAESISILGLNAITEKLSTDLQHSGKVLISQLETTPQKLCAII
eukprot:scaffold62354_cov42-Prasinocladus_malaysianus.AAC.1